MWMDAATVAHQGFEAVMRGDTVYVNGRANRAIAAGASVLPERLVYAIMRRQGRRFRKL